MKNSKDSGSHSKDIYMFDINHDFWNAIDSLIAGERIVINRPKGTSHPRFPNIRYKVDYGYIENTSSMDGSGIDVWRGSMENNAANAIICTVDLMKKDSEIKILVGCTEEEIKIIYYFHNDTEFMKGILIRR